MTNKPAIEKLIRPEIRALKAYAVPSAKGMVKLDAMENPYGWPPAMVDAWLEALRGVALNRYPDPAASALKERLRAGLAVPAGMELLLGNGSDELIQMILLALARPGATVLAPVPTFAMYELIAVAANMKFIGVPLTDGFDLDVPAMQAAIAQHKPAVIFLSYPNNPTGNLFSSAAIEAVLRAADGLVVLDEAYHAFAGKTYLDRLGGFDNLLVMRTLSKQGLAGLRLGVLAGDRAWLREFDKVRLPYNIGSLTQATAAFALDAKAVLDEQAARIRADRDTLTRELKSLPGLRVWPSEANFILFRVESGEAERVFQALLAAGVLIKNLAGAGGALAGCLRVTVGAPAENAAFLQALRAAL
ncbi:MAG: histidinol-phosphate transaminase [Gammaproteobacteria bacterium]|nr:histidinol-phosphate transaminase [Gammaproteobacteria bacterium]